MKLTKLAALAKNHGALRLIDTREDGEVIRQHVAIGAGIYPLDGLPVLDKEMLLILLDIPKDRWQDYAVVQGEKTEYLNHLVEDNPTPEDTEVTLSSMRLVLPQKELTPVYTRRGMVFLDPEYMAPIKDEKNVEWWRREIPGEAGAAEAGMVLVAKRGYQAIATVAVEADWAGEEEAETLWHMAQEARRFVEKAR